MTDNRTYGDAVAHSLGLTSAPTRVTRSLRRAQVAMTRISCSTEHLGMTPEIPPEDTFIVAHYLTAVERHELWAGNRLRVGQGYAANSTRIVNLVEGFSANILCPHESVAFYIPRSALNDVTGQMGRKAIGMLDCPPGAEDSVIRDLSNAVLPVFDDPALAETLFLDQIASSICTYVVVRYGQVTPERWVAGGLAPYQLRRARDMMASRCDGDISLADIANACGFRRAILRAPLKGPRAQRPTSGCCAIVWIRQRIFSAIRQPR
jgi:AraC family transcriptional regulator